LYGVSWSGTEFVAVGWNFSTGVIMTSPDGVAWTTLQFSGISQQLAGITWSGTRFVIVGAGGTILTSP
jgi:hypothetical protein